MVVAILGKGDLVGYDVNAVSLTPEHTQFGLSQAAGLKQPQPSGPSLMTGASCKLVKSSSDLKALTYCDLKCIHIAGLLDVLKLYPEFSDTFHREIIHDLSFNLRENHDLEHDNMMMGGHDEDDAHEHDADEDPDEEDDDDDDHHDGRGDGGGRKPASNMNHLFRSIEQQRSNQIGRYDYIDEDEHEDGRGGEEGLIIDEQEGEDADKEEDEEEEDIEEVDEEEEDDDDDEDDGAGGNNNGSSDRADNNDDNDRGPGVGGLAGSEQSKETNGGVDANKDKPNGQRSEKSSRQDSTEGSRSSETRKDETSLSAEAARPQERVLRRHRMRRMVDRSTKADADSVSWHSCEGLSEAVAIANSGTPKLMPRNLGISREHLAKTMMISKRNDSDELTTTVYRGSNNVYQRRSALKLGGRQQSATASDRKPQTIMFDLGPSTNSSVSRRRRSAGCIMAPRPLLIGPAAAAASRQPSNYSSLTHISENPACEPTSWPANLCGSPVRSRRQRAPAASAVPDQQGLESLDSRINCLSTSVRELKQEIRHELSQMRNTMQLFVRMAEQQERRQRLWHQSSDSLGQISSFEGKKMAASAARERQAPATKKSTSGTTKDDRTRVGVHRSRSASNLPQVNSNSNATSLIRSARRANVLREESGADLQSASSEHTVLVASQTSLVGPDQRLPANMAIIAELKSPTAASGLTAATCDSRTLSQCSSSQVSPLPPPVAPSSSQLQTYASSLQTSSSHSDNDSGRSSTSMNSSGQQLTSTPMPSQQMLVQQSEQQQLTLSLQQPSPIRRDQATPLTESRDYEPRQVANFRGARLAKVLFSDGRSGGQHQPTCANGSQYATTIASDASNRQSPKSKSSLV